MAETTDLPECVRTKTDMPDWREIGNFIVFEREPLAGGFTPFVRLREHREVPVMKAIAECFEHDRLHMDPEISDDAADDFKKAMIDNAIAQDWPIMTCGQPMTLGFLIVRPDKAVAHIDLLAVHPEYRGQHIGTTLLIHFLDWAHKNKFECCSAGTMAANAAACIFYQTLGFRHADILRTFHRP